jgi:hypothetical protein
VLGESYFGGADYYGQPTKIYAKSIENYINDRPYLDDLNHTNNYPNMLDPLDNVEDKDDDGVKDKKEDVNRNGILDGDKLTMDLITWSDPDQTNPFNIDNDAYVELPQNKGDPTQVPSMDEYEKAAVFQSVITHEIGHAVGMGQGDNALVDNLGHCFDDTCVMYQYSIDWKRADHFCPYHQNMIKIHNYSLND